MVIAITGSWNNRKWTSMDYVIQSGLEQGKDVGWQNEEPTEFPYLVPGLESLPGHDLHTCCQATMKWAF